MRNIVDQADEIIAIAPWSGQNDANDPKRTSRLVSRRAISMMAPPARTAT
jgi:hypothetical protein